MSNSSSMGDIPLEHVVCFEQGYDCIKFECINGSKKCIPGTGGSHGRHGLGIRFVVKGDEGAVQFVLNTGLTPQRAEPSSIGIRNCDWACYMLPVDLGYHSKTPRYDGQEPMADACEWCGGQSCYYDGSGLNASDAMYALVNGGGDALWEFLDAYYESVFHGAPYPTPVEYNMPLRK